MIRLIAVAGTIIRDCPNPAFDFVDQMSDSAPMADLTSARPAREDIVITLYNLFRWRGLKGVSLSDISEATGLGRPSRYHHFRGGKDAMVAAVADLVTEWVASNLLAPLKCEAPLSHRITQMLKATRDMYDGGDAPCLVASLTVSPGIDRELAAKVQAILRQWVDAIAAALAGNGLAAPEANRRATAAIVAIEGGLLVARACGDCNIFRDTLEFVKRDLLA